MLVCVFSVYFYTSSPSPVGFCYLFQLYYNHWSELTLWHLTSVYSTCVYICDFGGVHFSECFDAVKPIFETKPLVASLTSDCL